EITGTETIENCSPGDESCTLREEVSELDPATVSADLNCALPGNAGWCREGAVVSFSASEPVEGHHITWLEGNRGGGDFSLCDPPDQPNPSCLWPVPDGASRLAFWAHSSYGDTSAMATIPLKVDATAPTAELAISGTPNAAGWYRQAVDLDVLGEDATSGVAGRYIQVDGPAWEAVPLTLNRDGSHTVQAMVLDQAGNVTTTPHQPVWLDQTPPTLTVLPGRAPDAGEWYLGPVTVAAAGTDNLSGYTHSTYLLEDESGIPTTGTLPVTITAEGISTLQLTAYDAAGNTTPASARIQIDTRPPSATAQITGTLGANGWYLSPVGLDVAAVDAGSGICSRSLNLDETGWQPAPLPDYAGQGEHAFTGQAWDCLGQASPVTPVMPFKLDTVPPTLESSAPAPDGANHWYISPFTVTVSGTDQTSGLAAAQVRPAGGSWQDGALLVEQEGELALEFRSQDQAGNTTTRQQSFAVDLSDPTASLILSATAGLDPWYVSPVSVQVAAGDRISGVQEIALRLDGGDWSIARGLRVATDGSHLLESRITDNAGRQTHLRQSLAMDATAPTLISIIPAPDGQAGWHISPVGVDIRGSDATSGIRLAQVRAGATGAWQDGGLTLTREGVTGLEFQVQDNAGNLVTAAGTVRLDLGDPTLTITHHGSPGTNLWLRSPVHVSATATDAVSGVKDLQWRLAGQAWQSGPVPPLTADGTQVVEFRAGDQAGRETRRQLVVRIDQTAPTLAPRVNGTPGLNGWYVSPVTLQANAADATAGIAAVVPAAELSLSADGTHTIHWTAWDLAGNSAAAASRVQIDQTPPAVAFDEPAGPLVGTVTLTGRAADAGSGLQSVAVSTNLGLTWTPVSLQPDGSWALSWNTFEFPGGRLAVLARAIDQAGNRRVVSLAATIRNRPPGIGLTPRWILPEQGQLRLQHGDVDYTDVTLSICDLQERWPCRVWDYRPGEVPATVAWDGRFGDRAAPAGEYAVSATISDLLGRRDTAQAVVVVPAPPGGPSATPPVTPPATPAGTPTGPAAPDGTPGPDPTRTPHPPATRQPTPGEPPIAPPPGEPSHPAAPGEPGPVERPAGIRLAGPGLVWAGFCLALAGMASRDRRAREWRRLAAQLNLLARLQPGKGPFDHA
ncbi:MAG TPA: Ig-like domain repeat protein, partial [Anaerolineaceae bacterium]|nr:Ig-like domain repeat protein [Anaerolineaceae bacterium]